MRKLLKAQCPACQSRVDFYAFVETINSITTSIVFMSHEQAVRCNSCLTMLVPCLAPQQSLSVGLAIPMPEDSPTIIHDKKMLES
jgi:hypothetical protein